MGVLQMVVFVYCASDLEIFTQGYNKIAQIPSDYQNEFSGHHRHHNNETLTFLPYSPCDKYVAQTKEAAYHAGIIKRF